MRLALTILKVKTVRYVPFNGFHLKYSKWSNSNWLGTSGFGVETRICSSCPLTAAVSCQLDEGNTQGRSPQDFEYSPFLVPCWVESACKPPSGDPCWFHPSSKDCFSQGGSVSMQCYLLQLPRHRKSSWCFQKTTLIRQNLSEISPALPGNIRNRWPVVSPYEEGKELICQAFNWSVRSGVGGEGNWRKEGK